MSYSFSTDSIGLNLAVPIDLKQWRQQRFPVDWHMVEDILRADQYQGVITCRDRSSISVTPATSETPVAISTTQNTPVERSRHIPISDDCTIALVVSIQPTVDDRFAVGVEFWPDEAPYLPCRLQMSILDESNDPVIETYARDDNQKIEMKFEGEEGDRFNVRMVLGEDSMTIGFMV